VRWVESRDAGWGEVLSCARCPTVGVCAPAGSQPTFEGRRSRRLGRPPCRLVGRGTARRSLTLAVALKLWSAPAFSLFTALCFQLNAQRPPACLPAASPPARPATSPRAIAPSIAPHRASRDAGPEHAGAGRRLPRRQVRARAGAARGAALAMRPNAFPRGCSMLADGVRPPTPHALRESPAPRLLAAGPPSWRSPPAPRPRLRSAGTRSSARR
jgi:hypothetical protein